MYTLYIRNNHRNNHRNLAKAWKFHTFPLYFPLHVMSHVCVYVIFLIFFISEHQSWCLCSCTFIFLFLLRVFLAKFRLSISSFFSLVFLETREKKLGIDKRISPRNIYLKQFLHDAASFFYQINDYFELFIS